MLKKTLFGPAGNSLSFYDSGKKHTYEAPQWLYEMGLGAFEYSGGNGITASRETFLLIGEESKKYGISTSIHAPYYISLSSVNEEARLKSVKYVRQSIEAAEAMGAELIVVHCGGLSKQSREDAMALSRETIFRILEELSPINVKIGLETMGRINQLGTPEEVIELCKIDKCLYPVVDFGHLYARSIGENFMSEDDYLNLFDLINKNLGDEKTYNLHCHFSKIEYTKSGEKKHLKFNDEGFGPNYEIFMDFIAREKLYPRIICESAGTMAEDALTMQNYYNALIK